MPSSKITRSSQVPAEKPVTPPKLTPHSSLAKAISAQQRLVWQTQAVIHCVTQALYQHFGNWPASLPQWNLALETADQMLGQIADGLYDDVLADAAAVIEAKGVAHA